MIAKHVPMQSVAKSNFASLVAYLCDTQRKKERLGWTAVTNCVSATPEAAAREVLATQARDAGVEIGLRRVEQAAGRHVFEQVRHRRDVSRAALDAQSHHVR